MEDERISALLDSNNVFSLKSAQNDRTIRKLKSENDSLKACGFSASTVKWLIQKIKKQKSQYDTKFRGNENALVLTGSEIEFIQSINLSEDDVRTQEDVEKLLKHSARAGYILSKLYKARDLYYESTKLEVQDPSLQNLENEIKRTLEETPAAVINDICQIGNESDTDGPTSANFGDEPSIQCISSSTQTDLMPTISHNLFRRLNNIRLEFTCPEMRLSKLEENYESTKLKNALTLTSQKQTNQNRMYDLKTIAPTKRHLVSITSQQATEFSLLLQKYRQIKIFPKGSEIRESVLTCFNDSNTFYNENCSDGPKPSQRCCSSQTEISSLLIRSNFDDITTKDDVITKIEKMHGKFIIFSYGSTKSIAHGDRLKQYFKDLNDGKQITVFASDLSDELKTQIGKLPYNLRGVTQDTNIVKNLEVCSPKNNDITVKDLSIRRHSNSISDMQLISHEIDKQSNLVTEIQWKFSKQISDEESNLSLLVVENNELKKELKCERMKVKELEAKMNAKYLEISKLETKIQNQAKSNSQQQKTYESTRRQNDILQADIRKLSSQNNQLEINKKNARIQQLESQLRNFKAASRKTSQVEKDLSKYKKIAATAQKFQSELAKLKNELEQEKKSKNSSTRDKTNKRKS